MPDDNDLDPRLREIMGHWLPRDEAESRMEMILSHLRTIQKLVENLPGASFLFKVACMSSADENHSSSHAYCATLTGQQTREDAAIASALTGSGLDTSDAIETFKGQIGLLGMLQYMLDDEKAVDRVGGVLLPYHMMRQRENNAEK